MVVAVVLLVLVFLTSLPALAAPVETELMLDRAYNNEVDAVHAAGERVLGASKRHDREYFGAIVKDRSGRHWLTLGHGARGQDRFEMAVRPPAGTHVLAFWHTHGRAGAGREHFSGPDANLVRSSGLPLYLITPRGTVRLLRPERASPLVSAPRRPALGQQVAIAGEEVGQLRDGVRRT